MTTFRTARFLLAGTLAYNVVEGIIAIWSGIEARSLALVAFGADSYLEVAAAGFVLWRLGVEEERAEAAEGLVYRFIGWSFLLLAGAVLYEAGVELYSGGGAEPSGIGIALALASVTIMPAVAILKLRLAARLPMPVLAAEAKETLACSYLSWTLLAGLIANALWGWWWLDGLTALLLAPWLVREGIEGIRGDHCGEGATLCWCRLCWWGVRTCPPSHCGA